MKEINEALRMDTGGDGALQVMVTLIPR